MSTDLVQKLQEKKILLESTAQRVREHLVEGHPLDQALLTVGGLTEEQYLSFLAEEFQVPYMDLEQYHPSKDFLSQFPARILLEQKILPLEEKNGSVLVATSNLFDTSGLDQLRLATGMDLDVALAPAADIERCIKRYLGVGADTVQSMVLQANENGVELLERALEGDIDLTDEAEGASIIRFVNQILTEAIELRATDVHFEPFEDELRVRYRIDGVLQEATIPPEVRRFQAAIVSRLKILSFLDIAEKRLPQDGRIKIRISGREIDVRVSVIPMLHGEAVVLRLLDQSSVLLGPEQLGLSKEDQESFDRILALPHGIILVTGPTGSGKTTTLYAALSQINDVERKIITIEDPIEYQLRGINQIQVSTKAGLTFARGLRSILRHDPDVILIGEIRDLETAEIAVQASLTGHLVFSTLHTNDAPGALTRLVDMGIEPYLVASSLEAAIAQRLARMICSDCREEVSHKDDLAALQKQFGGPLPETMYHGRGCRKCQGTGYLGRRGIFELMILTEEIRSLILEGVSAGVIRKTATKQGMKSLREDARRYLDQGKTTIEEVMRITKESL
ncbi:MAG: Flp pilus assembly complex ATPase component TadA [Sedimentisphaerales bacterium]|nr:Flp pilus assembly complex ATPase component TadA [Sedimentisphaerales bacterium]